MPQDTALQQIVREKNLENLESALKKPLFTEQINNPNDIGDTPLHTAVESLNPLFVGLLLEAGADPSALNEVSHTPLSLSIKLNNTGIAELIMQHANFKPKNLCCAILEAVYKENFEMAEKLFNKINPSDETNFQTLINRTLWYAANRKKITANLIEKILKHNPQLDFSEILPKKTALHNAIENDLDEEIIQLLLKKGAKYYLKDSNDNTPLSLAIKNDNKKAIDLFLNQDPFTFENIDIAITEAVKQKEVALVKRLLEKCNHLENKTEFYKEAFHRAIQYGQKKMITLFLDNGADLNCQRLYGTRPLHTAISYQKGDQDREIISLLLDRGANMFLTNDEGKTPLNIAADTGFCDTLLCFLNHKSFTIEKCPPLKDLLPNEDNPWKEAYKNHLMNIVKFFIKNMESHPDKDFVKKQITTLYRYQNDCKPCSDTYYGDILSLTIKLFSWHNFNKNKKNDLDLLENLIDFILINHYENLEKDGHGNTFVRSLWDNFQENSEKTAKPQILSILFKLIRAGALPEDLWQKVDAFMRDRQNSNNDKKLILESLLENILLVDPLNIIKNANPYGLSSLAKIMGSEKWRKELVWNAIKQHLEGCSLLSNQAKIDFLNAILMNDKNNVFSQIFHYKRDYFSFTAPTANNPNSTLYHIKKYHDELVVVEKEKKKEEEKQKEEQRKKEEEKQKEDKQKEEEKQQKEKENDSYQNIYPVLQRPLMEGAASTELFSKIKKQEINGIQKILEKYTLTPCLSPICFDTCRTYTGTYLHAAIQTGNIEIVKCLLAAGDSYILRGSFLSFCLDIPFTPLAFAIWLNNKDIVNLLLNQDNFDPKNIDIAIKTAESLKEENYPEKEALLKKLNLLKNKPYTPVLKRKEEWQKLKEPVENIGPHNSYENFYICTASLYPQIFTLDLPPSYEVHVSTHPGEREKVLQNYPNFFTSHNNVTPTNLLIEASIEKTASQSSEPSIESLYQQYEKVFGKKFTPLDERKQETPSASPQSSNNNEKKPFALTA